MYQLTKNLAAKNAPHIPSALGYLGAILIDLFHLAVPYWRVQTMQILQTHAMVQKNVQENTQNNVVEGDIRKEMTVDTYQKYQKAVEAAANML